MESYRTLPQGSENSKHHNKEHETSVFLLLHRIRSSDVSEEVFVSGETRAGTVGHMGAHHPVSEANL